MKSHSAFVVALIAGAAVGVAFAGPDPSLVKGKSKSQERAKSSGSPGAPEAFPFSDNFDSYPDGPFPCTTPACPGPNGWSVWYTAGSIPGSIVSGGAYSGTKSLNLFPFSDVVQTGLQTTGQWVIIAQTWFPSAATAFGDDGYFIVMNAYNGVPTAGDQWAIQIKFDAAANTIRNDYTPAQTLPLVRDAWVEIRSEIDLDANTQSTYYGGQLLSSGPFISAGPTAIACIDLYSDGVDGMRFDTISMEASGGLSCYANCDGSTQVPFLNVADFGCFLSKFAAGDSYANCDGSTQQPILNVADFGCFLSKFAAGCSAP